MDKKTSSPFGTVFVILLVGLLLYGLFTYIKNNGQPQDSASGTDSVKNGAAARNGENGENGENGGKHDPTNYHMDRQYGGRPINS